MEQRDFPKTCCTLICLVLLTTTLTSCAPFHESSVTLNLRKGCTFPDEFRKCHLRNTRSTQHEIEMLNNTKITIAHFRDLEMAFNCSAPSEFSKRQAKDRAMIIMKNSPNGRKYLELMKSSNVTKLLELLDDLLQYMNNKINVTTAYEEKTICFMKSRIQQILIIPNHAVGPNGSKSRILEGVFLPQDNIQTEKLHQYMLVLTVFQRLYRRLNSVRLEGQCNNTDLKFVTHDLKKELPILTKNATKKFNCTPQCMKQAASKFAGKFLKRIQLINRQTKCHNIFKLLEALQQFIRKQEKSHTDRIIRKLDKNLNSLLKSYKSKSRKEMSQDIKKKGRHEKGQDRMRAELKRIPKNKWKVTVFYIYRELVRKVHKVMDIYESSSAESVKS